MSDLDRDDKIQLALAQNEYLQRVVKDNPALLQDEKFSNFILNQEEHRKALVEVVQGHETKQQEALGSPAPTSEIAVSATGELVSANTPMPKPQPSGWER